MKLRGEYYTVSILRPDGTGTLVMYDTQQLIEFLQLYVPPKRLQLVVQLLTAGQEVVEGLAFGELAGYVAHIGLGRLPISNTAVVLPQNGRRYT